MGWYPRLRPDSIVGELPCTRTGIFSLSITWRDPSFLDSSNGSIHKFPKCFDTCFKIGVSWDGVIYVVGFDGTIAYWNDGDWNVMARTSSMIKDFVVDPFHGILFTEYVSNRIGRMNSITGDIRTFAGSEEGHSDGLLLESTFRYPCGIAMDRSSIYIYDCMKHTIRRINVLGLWSKGKIGTLVFRPLFRNSFLFPPKMKKGIVSMMILSRREDASDPFTKLPRDILFLLFQLVTNEETYFQ